MQPGHFMRAPTLLRVAFTLAGAADVCLHHLRPLWFLGARRIGAFQAELTALFRALCWCLQLPDHFHLEIVSDCMSAIGIATGTQGGTSEDPLVARCRSAMHLLQALKYPQDIVVRHTRSHVGDPGNEVADALAKRVCRGGGAVDAAILPDIARTAARGSFAWLWLLVEAIRRPEAWPTFQYQALWDGPSPPPEPPAQTNVHLSSGLAATLTAHRADKPRPLSVLVCLQSMFRPYTRRTSWGLHRKSTLP